MRFDDRADAGRRLAARLSEDTFHRPLVLALPRGGVPVAAEVAARLAAPLDVFVARKIGAPGQPELGIGAIAEGGITILNEQLVASLGITEAALAALEAREQDELDRRVRRYRGDRRLPALEGRDVVLVDDGLATGVTASASIRALLLRQPRRLVLAVPVCAPETAARLRELCEVVCVSAPRDFRAVGLWYEVFDQTSDREVVELLERASTSDASRP